MVSSHRADGHLVLVLALSLLSPWGLVAADGHLVVSSHRGDLYSPLVSSHRPHYGDKSQWSLTVIVTVEPHIPTVINTAEPHRTGWPPSHNGLGSLRHMMLGSFRHMMLYSPGRLTRTAWSSPGRHDALLMMLTRTAWSSTHDPHPNSMILYSPRWTAHPDGL